MATVLRISTSVFSKLPKVSYQPVRGKKIKNPNQRKHEYEFLTNKNPYPDAPSVATGALRYYPRDPDTYQDPPYEPTKLLMVQRVKPMKGQPHWDRKVLTRLGLDAIDDDHIVILKNTEYICEDLWKVKHLVKVTPITFPNGEPTEEDIERTVLTPQGEMIVGDAVRPDPQRVEAQEKFLKDPLRLDGKTKRERFRDRWNSGWFM
ncbi:39S ribosomal protein L30, mitochondrial [Thrips palmi]|uniref:Large ribosomal subunit protein uL30m n=1 Tax=Thrips palmi TaxID=161013 RepID=A0A6P8ZCM8_THRPL|nr:39S ribosomal protein L30, mitochondrial [Thrips palmi]